MRTVALIAAALALAIPAPANAAPERMNRWSCWSVNLGAYDRTEAQCGLSGNDISSVQAWSLCVNPNGFTTRRYGPKVWQPGLRSVAYCPSGYRIAAGGHILR